MVKNSDKTYGQLMQEARSITHACEVGDIQSDVNTQVKNIIDSAVQANHENGVKGKYYIHIFLRKEPYANNTLHIFPQCRRTRPSPHQSEDHLLWSVDDGKVIPEWNLPSHEVMGYILANPHNFDPKWVSDIRKFTQDKLETLSDYLVGDKVI